MNNFTPPAAAIAIVVASLVITTSSNAQSPMNDADYCHSLVTAYSQGYARGSLPVGAATAVAIAQCQEGNAKPAIPVLEQKLREADIPLPVRG
jgi:hypothetical protein